MKKNILLLFNSYWWNAAAYHTYTLANGLHRKGIKVIIGTAENTPFAGKVSEEDIPASSYPFFSYSPLQIFISVSRITSVIRSDNIDCIHCLSSQAHFFGALAARFSNRKIPLIRSCLDSREPVANPVNRFLMRNITEYTVFPCTKLQEEYRRKNLIVPDRSSVIFSGIDIDKFTDYQLPDSRKDEGPVTVSLVGRLSPEKGVYEFLQVMKRVIEKRQDIRYVISGKEEQISIKQVKEQARELGILQNGTISGQAEDVRDIIAKTDIGAVMSRFSEVIPRIPLEYMAFKIPVVATDVNVLPETVSDGETGFIHNKDDLPGIAGSILRLAEDNNLRKTAGENGYQRLLLKFDAEIMVNAYLNLYMKLTDAGT